MSKDVVSITLVATLVDGRMVMFPVKDKGRLKQKPRHSRPGFLLLGLHALRDALQQFQKLCRLIVVFRLRGWSVAG